MWWMSCGDDDPPNGHHSRGTGTVVRIATSTPAQCVGGIVGSPVCWGGGLFGSPVRRGAAEPPFGSTRSPPIGEGVSRRSRDSRRGRKRNDIVDPHSELLAHFLEPVRMDVQVGASFGKSQQCSRVTIDTPAERLD